MKKIMTIVGTRPEIIKLSRVISEFDKHTNHILVHTGQNYDYELNEVFFNELEIRKPDFFLEAAGENTAETIGNVIYKSDEIMEKIKPDAILRYGDTNSCLSVISAKRKKIPVFHFEAGNRCFDQRVPEELNRKVVDHLSDINMPLTEHARRYLIQEGIRPETIIKIGSCMEEVLEYYGNKIESSDICTKLDLKEKNFFVVSAHREENVDTPERLSNLMNSLNRLVGEYNMPVIFSVHPRTKARLDKLPDTFFDERVKLMKAMGFMDYIKLQKSAKCVISDSGTIAEESSLLNFPAVTLRQAHERPEGMDKGILIMSDINPNQVLAAVETVLKQHDNFDMKEVEDYRGGQVSVKVSRIIYSYTDYINRTVWRKYS